MEFPYLVSLIFTGVFIRVTKSCSPFSVRSLLLSGNVASLNFYLDLECEIFNWVLLSTWEYIVHSNILKIFFYPPLEIIDPHPLLKNLNCTLCVKYFFLFNHLTWGLTLKKRCFREQSSYFLFDVWLTNVWCMGCFQSLDVIFSRQFWVVFPLCTRLISYPVFVLVYKVPRPVCLPFICARHYKFR